MLVAGYYGIGKDSTDESSESVLRIDVAYGFEAEEEDKLVGFAENVFKGRVIEQVGSEDMPDPSSVPGDSAIPQTQFSVEPLDNIKGKLNDTVTVNQQGGYIEQDGEEKKALIEGDPLLEPGKEYLFVTRYEKDNDWHTIAAQPYGDIKVEKKVKYKKVKEKFEKAKKNQKDPSKKFPKEK